MSISPKFMEELIRGVCHDVGAPARHVVQFTQMLNEVDFDDNLDDKHQRWLTLITNGGLQIQTMLANLSYITRLTICANEIEVLCLRELFNQTLSMLKKSNRIKFPRNCHFTINDDWPSEIYGCKEHWQCLFIELLSNALKFHPKSEEHAIYIAISCKKESQLVFFTIKDNGIGIRTGQELDMCRAFKRLNTREDYSGLGMGLTYCQYIAELNDAELLITNNDLAGLQVSYKQPIIIGSG